MHSERHPEERSDEGSRSSWFERVPRCALDDRVPRCARDDRVPRCTSLFADLSKRRLAVCAVWHLAPLGNLRFSAVCASWQFAPFNDVMELGLYTFVDITPGGS